MGACRFDKGGSRWLMKLLVVCIAVMTVLELSNSITAEAVPSATDTEPSGSGETSLVGTSPLLYLPIIYNNYCGSGGYSPFNITDTYYSYQWNMRKINADDAWQACVFGSSSVTVAVIDTGADLDHPDLVNNLLAGYDFIDSDTIPEDGNEHGTHVSGIIAAGLNGIGVVGVAPMVKILPVRVLDNNGSGSTSNVALAVYWAADRAKIINLSLGSAENDPALQAAINYAVNIKGCLVIAAAGNSGAKDNTPLYPAAYSNVLAVGAVDSYDSRAYFSNYGDYLDIAAPGVNIKSTVLNGGYYYESGTSQASPHVAGLAALIWSKYPSLTANQVRYAITSSAVDLGTTSWDIYYGWGRIDATAALNAAASLASGATVVQAMGEDESKAFDLAAENRDGEILPGYVLVQYEAQASAKAIESSVGEMAGAAVEKTIPELDVVRLQVPVGQEWATIDALRQRSDVVYAGPEYVYHMIEPVEGVEDAGAGN